MSTIKVSDKCVICGRELDCGRAICIAPVELTDNVEYSSKKGNFGTFRVKFFGGNSLKKAVHPECWDNLDFTANRKVAAALDILIRYGQIDGAHHKTWVIDQAVRALTGDKYDDTIEESCYGEDGPETYSWDTGTPP